MATQKPKFTRSDEKTIYKNETLDKSGNVSKTLTLQAYVLNVENTDTGEVTSHNKIRIQTTSKKWSDDIRQFYDAKVGIDMTPEEFNAIIQASTHK